MSWAAHQNLLRLKVAVGIAFLHESPRVETEHVMLADAIVQASLRVQRECEALIAKSEFNEQVARARTAERVVEITGDEKLRRLLKSAMGKLQKADGEFVYWNDLRPAFRDRAEWGEPLWSALSDHENVEVVVEGKSRKARWVQ